MIGQTSLTEAVEIEINNSTEGSCSSLPFVSKFPWYAASAAHPRLLKVRSIPAVGYRLRALFRAFSDQQKHLTF